jgi:PAS domain S-box-containing protein
MWRNRRAAISSLIGLGGLILLVVTQRAFPEPASSLLASLAFVGLVAYAGILGGWNWGIAMTIVALLVAAVFFDPPYYERARTHPVEILRLGAFGVVGLIFSAICGLLQRAWRRLEERQQRLQQEIAERGKAEAAEQLRADELMTTLACIGDGVITTDAEGRVVYLNRVAKELIGWNVTDAIGQPLESVFRILEETTRAPVANLASQALRSKQIVAPPRESMVISKQGVERPIGARAAPIKTADGRLIGCVLTFRDLTEQKQAAEALRASERRFSGFMEHSSGLAWIKDAEGRYLYANDAAVKAFRTTRAELYGKTDADIFDAETARQFHANDLRALHSPTGIQTVETLADENGVTHYSIVHKFLIPGWDNAATLVGGTALDITEQMQIEQELRDHQERLERAQHAGRIGTFDWNIRTDAVKWSRLEEEIFGLPRGTFGGKYESFLQMVHPEDREQTAAECRRVIDEGSELEMSFRILRPDGQVRWISAQGKVERDGDGRPLRMVGVNIDITERRNAEIALREADRRKDEFLAILAHELRNPLAPLRSGLDILQVVGSQTPEMESIRLVMDRQLKHMVRLIDDLLDISRISRHKLALRLERLSIQNVIASAVELVRPAIEDSEQQLHVSLPDEAIYLQGDFTRLSQVFGNLLSNSAKFTPSGGSITVSAEAAEENVIVRIRDTGIGIPAESLPRIFEMFSQVDRSLERTSGGLGIGLALVKALVEMHGGQVRARSDGPHRGTEFEIRLPRDLAAQPALPTPSENGSPNVQPCRILIVDDNHDAGQCLALMLNLQGHQTRFAQDGLAGLDIAESYRPDLIFLDIGMPKFNGYDVARRIRQQAWGSSIRLVALTGWGQEEDRRKSQAAGFDAHLVKPVDRATLAKVVADLSSAQANGGEGDALRQNGRPDH